MTLAQQLGISERAHDVYRILWGPCNRKSKETHIGVKGAHGEYPTRGGELIISPEEMETLLRELQEAHFLLALNSRASGDRKYVRTDSGRREWVRVHGS